MHSDLPDDIDMHWAPDPRVVGRYHLALTTYGPVSTVTCGEEASFAFTIHLSEEEATALRDELTHLLEGGP